MEVELTHSPTARDVAKSVASACKLQQIGSTAVRVTTAPLVPMTFFFSMMPFFVKPASRHTCVCWICHGMLLLLRAFVRHQHVWKAVCPKIHQFIQTLNTKSGQFAVSLDMLMGALFCKKCDHGFYGGACCRHSCKNCKGAGLLREMISHVTDALVTVTRGYASRKGRRGSKVKGMISYERYELRTKTGPQRGRQGARERRREEWRERAGARERTGRGEAQE